MARRGLRFLDDLDAAETKKLEKKAVQNHEALVSVSDILDLPDILGLNDFNPDLVF